MEAEPLGKLQQVFAGQKGLIVDNTASDQSSVNGTQNAKAAVD